MTISKEREREENWRKEEIQKYLDRLAYDVATEKGSLCGGCIDPTEFDELITKAIKEAFTDICVVTKLIDVPGSLARREVMRMLFEHDLSFIAFSGWMSGQGCPILRDGEMGYYKWDVDRYIDNRVNGTPLEWD